MTGRAALSFLTAADRELVQATTGEQITDETWVASPFAFELAADRQYTLPEGSPITAGYITGLMEKYQDAPAGQSPLSAEWAAAALRHLASTVTSTVDLTG